MALWGYVLWNMIKQKRQCPITERGQRGEGLTPKVELVRKSSIVSPVGKGMEMKELWDYTANGALRPYSDFFVEHRCSCVDCLFWVVASLLHRLSSGKGIEAKELWDRTANRAVHPYSDFFPLFSVIYKSFLSLFLLNRDVVVCAISCWLWPLYSIVSPVGKGIEMKESWVSTAKRAVCPCSDCFQ